jgi:hypothetical protein
MSHTTKTRADSILRREFLRVGLGGLTLPSLLALRGASAARPAASGFGRAKSCIVLFAWGGMSHFETLDPKPEAPSEIRGIFDPIKTSADGIRFSEHLPKLARHAHQMAVVRSVFHDAPAHRPAAYWNLTGHAPRELNANWPVTRQDWPSLGSMVSAAIGSHRTDTRSHPSLPRAVALPYEMADGGKANGQDGGFLGITHDPVIVRPRKGREYDGVSPSSGRIELGLPPGIDLERMRERRGLSAAMEHTDPVAEQGVGRAQGRARELAMEMLLSDRVRLAFDLDRERPETHARYGDHICGQSTLLARRLVESGVPLATVYCAAGDLNGSIGDHFDTHANNFNRLKNNMLPPLDQASSALLTDLEERGLLDETLVVWLTEFGRTPKINSGVGRDHYPNCYSVAFAGGGIRGGLVYGASNRLGAEPAESPCGPPDLHATIFHALGIPSSHLLHDLDRRPLAIADGNPLPLF